MRRMRSWRIDHQDALAQVLHDVLRELREVGEVDFLAAHQRFALAQAVGDRPQWRARPANSTTPSTPAVGVVGGRSGAGDADEHLLHQHAEGGDRGDQKARRDDPASTASAQTGSTSRMPSPLATPPLA